MTLTSPPDALRTPIDDYLARQHGATAVDRFSAFHEGVREGTRFEREGWYTDRVPLSAPGPGEQYAFRVDLDRCSGCKSCVAACHSLNGLDEGESWRSVGQLVGGDPAAPSVQSVPTGCHHCVEPACLAGCPTNAYEKDPFTGIVRHLDDQCIGCGYCELTCPYEVPRLNLRLGVVRKCDLCADRLAVGEEPACVQACPTHAIEVAVVEVAETMAATRDGALVPGAPASATTAPTTRYVSRRPLGADLVAADHHVVHLSKAHPPLAFMLVLTQLSVGAFLATLLLEWLAPGDLPAAAAAGAAVAGVLALAASVLHLGRPAVAWRAVLGMGHSWLSREIVAFGVYAPLATGHAIAVWQPGIGAGARAGLGIAAAGVGLLGVGCSALIYVATGRTWWRPVHTVPKFVLSGAVTGPLLVLTVLAADGPSLIRPLAVTVIVAGAAKLAWELTVLRGRHAPGSDLDRTASLLNGPLRIATRAHIGLGVTGTIVVPAAVLAMAPTAGSAPVGLTVLAASGLAMAIASELLERLQFFAASVAPRMPGGFGP